ncbi:MAG TPA: hypothetical protein VGO67_16370 [Verrucomicrobiae bacterium]|jgi:hypothetical protein
MKEEQHQFLTLVGQAPARLTVEQVAWLLGCQPHDVPILVSTRLLKPLGNPPQNGTKYFSRMEVIELTKDRAWLAKMTQTISQHWHKRNIRQKGRFENGTGNCITLASSP